MLSHRMKVLLNVDVILENARLSLNVRILNQNISHGVGVSSRKAPLKRELRLLKDLGLKSMHL